MKYEKRRWFGWLGPRWTRKFFASAFIISGAAANSSKSYSMIQDTEPTCSDFADRRFTGLLSWTLDDCIDIWSAFRDNISRALNIRPPHVDVWKATADELRQAGKPCMLTSFLNAYSSVHGVGVGSTTWKHLATWILAEEAGCDWVTPSWTSSNGPARNETVTYCHWVKDKSTRDRSSVLEKPCVSVNWLAYFNFGVPSTDVPEGITLRNVTETNINQVEFLGSLKSEIAREGLANVPWDRVLITVPSILASLHLATAGSWDERKREIGRNVLQEARKNFHDHPRPWYNEHLDCGFDPSRLNVAVHMRLGDVSLPLEIMSKYLSAVEELMDTATEVVVDQGLEPPLFHVFSETMEPCPSLETNYFDEFPTWTIESRQVQECFETKLPEDCERNAIVGACSPNGSGMFRIHQKPILLHVGRDVLSSLSCMIQSDGVVMGCSAFGQIAGLLTNGISFFTVQCEGRKTAAHYKSIPALAVAERGHRWVPITGTWSEPMLNSTEILGRVIKNQINGGALP